MNVLFDGMKELMLSVGTDIIKETSEEHYDEKKIQEELEQYIERERAAFENIDMQLEIDFHNLEDYFKKNLLSDFKESLYGNSEQRKVKKQYILEKLCRHTGADQDEGKKQYVSKIFNLAYDIVGNYYARKVPVAVRHMANADKDEIIDAYRKESEELKEEFRQGIKKIGQPSQDLMANGQTQILNSEIDNIYKSVIKKIKKDRFKDAKGLRGKYEAYSDFFKMFVEVTEEEKGIIPVDNLFAFVKQKINENAGEDFIKICGPDGTGKSSFLMILYQYLYECYCKKEIRVYPYYIDLHHYEWEVVEVTDKEELRKEAEKYIRKDMEAVAKLGETGIGLVFLIDGNDNYFRTDLKPGPILESVLEGVKENNIKIICIGEKANVQQRRKRKAKQFIQRVTSYTFRFSPAYSGEKEKCREIVQQYYELEWKRGRQDGLNDRIEKFNIKEIDYNLLSVFRKCLEQVSLEEITSLHDLYYRYCMNYLDGNEKRFEKCEHLAYTYFMTDEWIKQESIAKNYAEWELVHQHKSLSNYLIACYYADIILNCDEDREKQLEIVFTNGINIFLKSIITEEVDRQTKALEGCKRIFAKGGTLAKAQAAYILGRMKSTKLKERAKKILEEQQKALMQKETKDSMDCFLLRTIYVSLLYLGESDAGEEFLAYLFKSPVMNEVNRAFYLQYYDDIKQQPENVNGETINLRDDGENSITNTASVLLSYIERQFNVEPQNWSPKESADFQIHLFTLCSLLQVRIEKKDMKEFLNKLKLVISRTLEQASANISDDMKIYLNMLRDDIENSRYSSGHIYDELYGVKDIERSGWCKKITNLKKLEEENANFVRCENVAEHMYYAWLMGMLYLPETKPDGNRYKGYQKEVILRCLLTHDLAEKYVGDKLPEESTEEHRIRENEWMHKIFMHDIYDEIASMDAYRQIWERFGPNSTDINGVIAKEIDIIQSIYQFCIYKEMGAEFPSSKEEEWKREKNKIKTSVGKKILKEVVLKRFNI